MGPPSPAKSPAFLLAALLASTTVLLAREAAAGSPADSWTGHAVIVGISEYKEVTDLFLCDDDAEDVRNTLLLDAEHWSESDIEILLNSDATVDGIHAAIEAMRLATESTDDVCLFFFSGHGSVTSDLDGDEKADDKNDRYDETLVTYEALSVGGQGVEGQILDDQLSAWLSAFTTQRLCVIIDACYAGGMAKSSGTASAADWVAGMAQDIARTRPAAITKSPVPGTKDINDLGAVDVVALMSCEEGQESEEDFILWNGVFTFFVVQAMCFAASDTNADGFVSAEEIFAYASPRTAAWNPKQTPLLFDSQPGDESQLPVITAGDRYVERIVAEEDLPFGGGIKGGCASPFAPLELRRGATEGSCGGDLRRTLPPVALAKEGAPSGPGARPEVGLAWLVALAAALGLMVARRRAFAALAPLPILVAAAGCLHPNPSTRHAYQADGGPPPGLPVGDRSPSGADSSAAGAPSMLPDVKGTAAGRAVLGVRAGALVPFGSRNTHYSETVQAGLFAAGMLGNVPIEIGVDVCRLRSRGVDVTAHVLTGRLDVLAVSGQTLEGRESYCHFGPRLLVDFVETYWGGASEVALAMGAGVGFRRPGGGWDVRFSVDGLLGSSNIAGFLNLSAGFRF